MKIINMIQYHLGKKIYFLGIAVLEKMCQLNIHLEVPEINQEQTKVIF